MHHAIALLNATTLHVLVILFVATLIRSAFGFGEALVAVPLLSFYLPVKVAAPLAVLVSITVALLVVAQDWRKIHVRSAGWLVSATLLGIPLGLELLTSSHQQLLKGALGLLVMGFAAFSLLQKSPIVLERDRHGWLVAAGFCAGVLGGAYGMNGPPLVMYGAMRRWSAQHFRATLQGYFLPASVVGMVGYWAAGLWIPEVTHLYLVSLPVTVPGILLGRVVNHRLGEGAFLHVLYVGLIAIGALLVGQALRGR